MITANTPSLAMDSRALDGLRGQAKADPKGALRAAAKQLESVFLGMMLKAMRDASLDDPYFSSNESKLYTEMFDRQLTQSMAEGKGFGLAEAIYRQLSARIDLSAGKPAIDAADEKALVAPKQETKPLPGASGMAPLQEPRTGGEAGSLAESPRHFVSQLWPHAEKAARTLGVPAHFLLGHAALESGWGRREIVMPDGSSSHNLFGIKAGAGWSGATTAIMTTEYVNGVARQRLENFRAYGSYEEAFQDYGDLLSRRYPLALSSGGDTEQFARSLARGGYATDPLYADKLHRVINSGAMRHALLASDQV